MSLHSQSIKARIDAMEAVEAPVVAPVNLQVRTGLSVPFAPYMTAGAGAGGPEVAPVDFQVRTGLSVPFSPSMVDKSGNGQAPDIAPVSFQVRTGLSIPFASYMLQDRTPAPSAAPADLQVRTGLSVAFNPYMLGAHAEELLRKRIMISPVVVLWRYAVPDDDSFADWLSTREILLSESRMAGDPELKGVRYGGTYRIAGGESAASWYRTVWGYTSEAAMNAMHRLCSDDCASASLVQLELIDFVKGLKRFVAQAGERHFTQETLVSASAGRG
jgi:hypothetical protein